MRTLTFTVNEQNIINTTGEFASNTVAYIEAEFNLNGWDFDTIRAVWHTRFEAISTELVNGRCVVPHEVLDKVAKVYVNLTGSNLENGELVERLTTFPVLALEITKNALVTGDNSTTPTPSEYEQFVASVREYSNEAITARDEAEQILTDTEQIKTDVENLKTQTLAIKDETESIKGDVETLKSQTQDLVDGFNDEVEEALDRISAKEGDVLYDIDSAKTSALGEINDKETLALAEIVNAKSSALTDISSARVTTLTEIQTEGTTQKNLVTTEGQTQVANVQTEGQTQITAIEDKGAEVIANIPYFAPIITDTAEGSIASFTDGADDYPMKSVVAQIVPKQEGSGDPSPDNVRPISGWSGVNVNYQGSSHYIPFKDSQDNPITVYGGNMNITVGEGEDVLMPTKLKDLNWVYQTAQARFYTPSLASVILKPSTSADIPQGLACECYKPQTFDAYGDKGIAVATSGNIFLKDSSYTDVASLLADMGEYKIVYPLATPTPIYCEPTEVKSLLGNNNVWADTGDTSVEYCADTKLYINKLING